MVFPTEAGDPLARLPIGAACPVSQPFVHIGLNGSHTGYPEFGLNHLIVRVHHCVMCSLGFWTAFVLFGGPFGLAPAQAALLEEIVPQNGTGALRPAAYLRIVRRGAELWRRNLFAGIMLSATGTALGAAILFGQLIAIIVAGAVLVWALIYVGHQALRQALGLAPHIGSIAELLMGALPQLAGLAVWFVLIITAPLSLPFAILAGPWLAGTALSLTLGHLPAALETLDRQNRI